MGEARTTAAAMQITFADFICLPRSDDVVGNLRRAAVRSPSVGKAHSDGLEKTSPHLGRQYVPEVSYCQFRGCSERGVVRATPEGLLKNRLRAAGHPRKVRKSSARADHCFSVNVYAGLVRLAT